MEEGPLPSEDQLEVLPESQVLLKPQFLTVLIGRRSSKGTESKNVKWSAVYYMCNILVKPIIYKEVLKYLPG